jgi:polyphosphate kinase
MPRNLDRRVEVAVPILDERLRKQLIDMFTTQWKDTSSVRILDNELNNYLKKPGIKGGAFRSQIEFYNYLNRINHVQEDAPDRENKIVTKT